METLYENQISPELDEILRDFLCRCYPPPERDAFLASRAWHGSAPSFTVFEEKDGIVTGHIGIVRRLVRVGRASMGSRGNHESQEGWEDVEVAGVQNVAVLPETRGSGLGRRLMAKAMDHAAAQGIPFGLLFCIPELESYYASMGWVLNPVAVTMDWEGQIGVPIPEKNICMVRELAGLRFPPGPIHLNGADW